MSEMIDVVAQAIDDAVVAWQPGSHQRIRDVAARAAIEAMRKFIPIVRENGEVVHELRGAPADIWRTMFDAATD